MDSLQLLRFEYGLYWLSVILYSISTILFVYGVFFEKEKQLAWAAKLPLAGLLPHTVAIVLRWYASGHGPYLNKLEAFSSTAWIVIVIFLWVIFRNPKLKSTGIVVMPAGFLLIAFGVFRTSEIQNLPATFHTIWLILHIFFTKLALAAILIALGCSIFYLLKERKGDDAYPKLPDRKSLDAYAYKFSGFSFIFWSITIIAGSIWAHKSWGRYWAWDPIETWSLITWLVFGLNMHLRRFHGLKGRKAAYFMVVCFAFIILVLFILPFITLTVHTEYLM